MDRCWVCKILENSNLILTILFKQVAGKLLFRWVSTWKGILFLLINQSQKITSPPLISPQTPPIPPLLARPPLYQQVVAWPYRGKPGKISVFRDSPSDLAWVRFSLFRSDLNLAASCASKISLLDCWTDRWLKFWYLRCAPRSLSATLTTSSWWCSGGCHQSEISYQ